MYIIGMERIEFRISVEELKVFVDYTKEIVKFNDTAKLLITNNSAMYYTNITNKGTNKHVASKIFEFKKPKDLFSSLPIPEPKKKISINFMELKTVSQQLELLVDSESDITMSVDITDNGVASLVRFASDILEMKVICMDDRMDDLSTEGLDEYFRPHNADYSFTIEEKILKKLMKLISLMKTELVELNVNNGVITLSEQSYNFEISKTDSSINDRVMFDKKYLKLIKNGSKELITMCVFESYCVIDENKSYQMFVRDLI
jgi:hypothetical protein